MRKITINLKVIEKTKELIEFEYLKKNRK